jgi:hypothetical protein
LFAVLALVLVLGVSSFSPVAAAGYIAINKVTTNGDTTTEFPFQVSGDLSDNFELASGDQPHLIYPGETVKVTVIEVVPDGWFISDISCEGLPVVGREPSSFTMIPGEGVVIEFVAPDTVTCTFTNSPVAPAVGGVVMPANTLAIVAPWLAVIGVVGCIGIVVVARKKRHP